jgi:aryl-alcohol dehydrogenase-like predicted oxidoreductase
MEYTNLGSTGLKVSRICLGTMTYGSKKWREWVLEEPESQPFIKQALDAGINFFDTADVYSNGVSEEILGRALEAFGPSRDQLVVATKLYNPMGSDLNQRGLSRKHIRHAIDDSLRRLQTDYIDLYQIHRFDYETPMEETLEALDELVRDGKVLYLGASSMYAWQFAQMLALSEANGWARFVTMQNHYNLIYREEEREMNPLCRAEGIGLIPWSPLARGVLAGNRQSNTTRARTDDFAKHMYGKETTEADQRVVDRLVELSKQRGIPAAQLALAWLLHKPEVTAPIVGASKPGHLQDAIASVEVKLTKEEIARIEEPYIPHAVAGLEGPGLPPPK